MQQFLEAVFVHMIGLLLKLHDLGGEGVERVEFLRIARSSGTASRVRLPT
jgi:hypothetical protein